MDLRSGYPFWLLKNGIIKSYPVLEKDLKCDAVIIGGGITGALVAYYLFKAGMDVIVLEKRHIGLGSTCATTSLLQYEIDTPLNELIEKVGKINAEKSYLLCLDALEKIKNIAKEIPVHCEFKSTKSLYLASAKKDVKKLKKEYSARKNIGIRIDFLEEKEIEKKFSLFSPAALYSHDAAEMDPYQFTHGVFSFLSSKGVRIFDNTNAEQIKHSGKNAEVITQNGFKVKAKKIVYANGYESVNYFPETIAQLHSTYAIISKPVQEKLFNYLIWESARPYLYMRTTADKRIIVGGKDEMFYSPGKRDQLIKRKSKQLIQAFHKKFPSIPFSLDFSWAGTFAETKDGLPFIGVHKKYPNAFFALGFGGNGITFGLIAAEVIADLLQNKKNSDAEIFSFSRLK